MKPNEYNYESEYADANILLIDDDPTSNMLLEHILKNKGFTNVTSIQDPRQALGVYNDLKPEAIILDLQMPHLDGFEVYKKIQETNSEDTPPVIVVSARKDHKSRDEAFRLGVQHFMEKPIFGDELNNKVEKLIRIRRLLKKEEDQTDNLIDMTVKTLLLSIRSRDQETEEHVFRIKDIVYILARGLGLDEKTAESFAKASMMHDMGKIGIPDSIMFKKASLDSEEWEMMKKHTLIGENILLANDSDAMKLAASIARSHHENWDGTGYPDGLSGEAIPLPARLTSVADVFDALMSPRPYKEAWSIEKTIAEVLENKEKKFDPQIVDVFIEKLEDIKNLYIKNINASSKEA